MTEAPFFVFLKAAVEPANVFFTVLLVLVVLYWLAVIIGAADMDLFEGDWMPDLETDSPGVTGTFAQFLGFGDVPFMLIVSIFAVFSWFISMVGNYYLNPMKSIVSSAGILAGNIVVSLIVTGGMVQPLKKLFNMRGGDSGPVVMYRVGVAVTSRITSKFGQVEIPTNGAPLLIPARTTGDTVINKGESVIVYDEDREKGIYFVERYEE